MIRRTARLALAIAQAVLDELERRNDAWLCARIGHDPSWTRAVRKGITDRPVCNRCDQPLGPA